jgi:hypothetical protein
MYRWTDPVSDVSLAVCRWIDPVPDVSSATFEVIDGDELFTFFPTVDELQTRDAMSYAEYQILIL